MCIGVTPECRQTKSEMIGDGWGHADEADEAYHDNVCQSLMPCQLLFSDLKPMLLQPKVHPPQLISTCKQPQGSCASHSPPTLQLLWQGLHYHQCHQGTHIIACSHDRWNRNSCLRAYHKEALRRRVNSHQKEQGGTYLASRSIHRPSTPSCCLRSMPLQSMTPQYQLAPISWGTSPLLLLDEPSPLLPLNATYLLPPVDEQPH